jgi:hypothetical protein
VTNLQHGLTEFARRPSGQFDGDMVGLIGLAPDFSVFPVRPRKRDAIPRGIVTWYIEGGQGIALALEAL